MQAQLLRICSLWFNITHIYTLKDHKTPANPRQSIWVRSFEVIWIRISADPRSLGSWFIKGTDESVTRVDSSVPFMHHDPSDLG